MFLDVDEDGITNDGDTFHVIPGINNNFRQHHLQAWWYIHWPKECNHCCVWKTR